MAFGTTYEAIPIVHKFYRLSIGCIAVLAALTNGCAWSTYGTA
jgi:hypothetical protein